MFTRTLDDGLKMAYVSAQKPGTAKERKRLPSQTYIKQQMQQKNHIYLYKNIQKEKNGHYADCTKLLLLLFP